MKKIFLHGFVAGILAALASIIYYNLYQTTLVTHFEAIVNVGAIIGASMFGCMLIAGGYALLLWQKKPNLTIWLNILVSVLSFASIISPISMSLPLDIATPELFPGLVVPMHFFPALAFFTLSPLFREAA